MKSFFQLLQETFDSEQIKPDTVDWIAQNVQNNPTGVAQYLVSMIKSKGGVPTSIFTDEGISKYIGSSLFRLLLQNGILKREENGYVIDQTLLI